LPSDINWLNIGGDAAGNNSLRGVIDDFAVFASALNEDQIIALAEGDRSILPAAPGYPIFVSASPDTAAADGSAELSVTLYKRGDDASNAQLSVNGQDVATTVAADGTTITITGTATGLASGTATAKVSYNGVSNAWAISVPNRPIDQGDGTITFDAHVAWEWWDGIGGAGPITLLSDNARYPDSPDGATFASSFNTRTALAGGFEGNGRDSYGGRMSGILTAPEDGTYRFFVASDDASVLRISTDTDPANAVQVAQETGCCKNFTLDDGGLSGTVDLVAGNQYYMEALLKEGGGGDWMTVGWRKPSEDIDDVPAGNQEGIPGEYFTGTVKVPALPALSASVSPANDAVDVTPDGSITLNISEGATTLDVASVAISLNGTKLEHTAAEGTWSKSFSIVTQEGKTHSITAPTGKLGGGTQNTISVAFTDSAGTVTTIESSFRVKSYHIVDMAAAGTVKYIESEDFDFDGGSFKTFEEVGTGGSYAGLGTVLEVDIHNPGNASPNYRVIEGNHPGMADASWDSGRNGFSMEVDFKMGWNDAGDWFNYTRDFPEGGTYAVFGRFSSGGNPVAVDLSVVTDGQGTEDQTLESVGTFTGPATGGWNTMQFFPLNDADGELAAVSLSGTSTVRVTILPGNVDMNYLAFVPYEQAVLFSAEPSTVKYIEVEDFDFDGGSFKTFEEVGTGGSYAGLGTVLEVDIHNPGNASPNYRVIEGNHPGMADSSWDSERGGGNGFSMEVDFKMGWNDAGDWFNYTRDFPEDGSYAVYGRFSSGGNPIAVDLSVVTAGHGTEDQTLESLGTFTGPATGGWNTMQFFPLKDADGNLATVGLSGQSTVRLTILPGNVDMNYLAFVPYVGPDTGSGLVDISAAGDAVVASSDNHPAGEHAGLAIDNDSSTKYLNFDGANDNPSGLTITTAGGVVIGLGLTSANDAPDRDPATFVLSGSNDAGATFTEIASGDVPAFGARFERQEISFANEAAYTTYELIFPTTTGPSTCCMQIAEIELLATPAAVAPEPPALPWSVGLNDDGWPAGDGGGPNTTFVQESGVNELPGNPANGEGAQEGDDDYYWAGVYSTVIAGNGDYTPLGLVEANEESAERAFAGVDNDLRYHFNLPESLQPTDRLTVSYDALNLHGGEADSRYGIEVYFNNVQVQSEIVIREAELGQTYTTEPFTLADVNAEVGSGYDNIITLKGVNYNAEGGGNWMGIDYVQLSEAGGGGGETPTLPFSENFDSLELGPWVSDSESGGDGTDWTTTAPSGWVTATGEGHGPTAGGDIVTEFDGWSFVDPVTWNATAGQARDQFTKGSGVIAVADSDEYDDKADAKFNASLSTPAIDISGAAAGSVVLTYDSSWRQEPQSGKVTVSFDGGDSVTLLELTPATPTAYNETVSLNLNNPDGAQTAVISWEKQGHNNWWWAIDNITVAAAEVSTPTLSVVNNGDGTVTVTFEGTLQAAPTVNGPWENVDAPSPLTIPADQAQQYGRAVTE
jgi:hypothetical protein